MPPITLENWKEFKTWMSGNSNGRWKYEMTFAGFMSWLANGKK